MQDKWVKWEPMEGLAAYDGLDFIADNGREFKIVFYQHANFAKQVHVIFKESIDAYRTINESYLVCNPQNVYGKIYRIMIIKM